MYISSIRAQEVNKKNQPAFKMKFIEPLGISVNDKLESYIYKRLLAPSIDMAWSKMDRTLPSPDYYLHADSEKNVLILKRIKNLDLFRPNTESQLEENVFVHPFNFNELENLDHKSWVMKFIEGIEKVLKAERINQKAKGLSEQHGINIAVNLKGKTDFATNQTESAIDAAAATLGRSELKKNHSIVVARNKTFPLVQDDKLAFELYSNTPKQYLGKVIFDPEQRFNWDSFTKQITSIPLPY